MSEHERRAKLICLAVEVDEAYATALKERCTCYEKPERSCAFCRVAERADKKLDEFATFVKCGLED